MSARLYPARLAVTALLAVAFVRAAGAAGAANPFADRLWDDGRAEYSIYSGVTLRYGQPRSTEARTIVVKEDLLSAALVKSDGGPIAGRTVTAIKLNFSADFQTGTYTYHQAATVMSDRARLAPLKEVMAHHELCGITFVRVAPEHGRLVHRASSYWEGEAERTVNVEFPPGVPLWWDALPVSLRAWAGESAPLAMAVVLLPTQISGRSPLAATRPVRATLKRSAEALRVPAGRFQAVRFEIMAPAGADTLWFDSRPPFVMLQMATHEGRRLSLTKTLRTDYWNHHMNGDEKVLEE